MIHADTSFLVDLPREARRGTRGPATLLLDGLAGEEVRVGVHVLCELLAGAENSERPSVERQRVRRLCESLVVSYPDERFPAAYARVPTALRGAGRPIATMDLSIATAALVDGAAIVTRNVKHFDRVPGLDVRGD
ncbi:type II toxin-antitoxin system VapC family toxin [Candidatus Binatia bacterium]|nr:type II toxin-antitoxin system VapC family toxin [Candidatus Binatia bacterium]